MNKNRNFVVVLGGLLSTISGPVLAQSSGLIPVPQTGDDRAPQLSEIVVTGTKTGQQSVQRTPIAISVVDDTLLKEQGLNVVRDFAKYVPNLVFTQNAGTAIIYVRGIGSSNAGVGSDPSVTQQIDGVYIARPTAQTGDFIDVERIEVLRGPQGTLYGRNSVGGTLNVISRQPSSTFGGEVRVGYGNYDTKTAQAYLTGPLGDNLAASVSGTFRKHDEFFHNVVAGVPGTGAIERWGGRVQLRWQASSDFDLTLRGDTSKAQDSIQIAEHLILATPYSPIANALIGGLRDIAIDGTQPQELHNRGFSLDINYDLGNGFKLKSITAYRHMDTVYAGDADGTEVPISYTTITERQNQLTQEFNLSYKSDQIRAVAGLFYFGDRDHGISNSAAPISILTPAAGASVRDAAYFVKTRSFAAFGQVDFNLTDQLSAIAGLRYTTEKKTFFQNFARTSLNPATLGASFPGFPIIFDTSRRDHAFTPKFGVNFQVDPSVLLYASATRGFKSGGFNNAATSAATAGFDPEKLWAYEAGTKAQFLDNKLRLNVAGFIYDYSDLQVRQLIGPGNAVIANAASARIKGVEIETAFKPVSTLTLSGHVSYLDAKYRSFPFSPAGTGYTAVTPGLFTCPNGGTCYDASGKRIVASPKWSGMVAVDFAPPLGDSDYKLNFHADYFRRGTAYFDASNVGLSAQRAYGVLNGNISLESPAGWRIEAYANNAGNKKYFQNLQGLATTVGGAVGDPRTYGVRLGYSF